MAEQEQQQMWKRSPTPEETWSHASGGNDSGEWPVIGVVGEELRLDGTSRYEVRWGNWHRADGSNTTWDTEDSDTRTVINRWKRVQKRLRNTLTDISLDMEVPWPDDVVHKRPTEHRKQAYEEKLEKRRAGGPISTADWDAEVDAAYARIQEPGRGQRNARLRVRRSVGGAGLSVSAAAAGMSSSSSPEHIDLDLSDDDDEVLCLPAAHAADVGQGSDIDPIIMETDHPQASLPTLPTEDSSSLSDDIGMPMATTFGLTTSIPLLPSSSRPILPPPPQLDPAAFPELAHMPPPPKSHLRAFPEPPAVRTDDQRVEGMVAASSQPCSSSIQRSMPPPPPPDLRALPEIPRRARPLSTQPSLPPPPPSDLGAFPELAQGQGNVTHSPTIPVVEFDGLSIHTLTSTASPSLPQQICGMPSRVQMWPLTPSMTAPSTQAGRPIQSPAIPLSQSTTSRTMKVTIPPVPGSDQMPTLDIPRPMTREDIRGQRDEVLHGLELPDAIQKMAKDLWSNDPNTEEAFMTDMAVKFRQVICDAVAVGNGTSVTLDFDRSSVRGPVAPIDPYHDAPLVEAFRKYYTEWAELHVRRCREMVVELMLLRQMEGLDDLIQCAEGLDTQWMADN